MDMRAVKDIDPCALLYMVAQVQRVSRSLCWYVHGNFPTSPTALRVLHDARFHEVFNTRRKRGVQPGPASLKIIFKPVIKKLNPKDWLPLHDFLRVNGNLTEDEAEDVYTAFGECVENVRQHAYPQMPGGMWHALAIRPSASGPARAVILDLGAGIARTIRRTRMDIVLQWMRNTMSRAFKAALIVFGKEDDDDSLIAQAVDRMGRDDWTCLLFATQGLRTRSSEKQRGTGLNGLREAVLNMHRGALHVLSGESAITWRGGPDAPGANGLSPPLGQLPFLHGTTVCLEFGGSHDTTDAPGGNGNDT